MLLNYEYFYQSISFFFKDNYLVIQNISFEIVNFIKHLTSIFMIKSLKNAFAHIMINSIKYTYIKI